MEARVIEEVPNLPVEDIGQGVYLVTDEGHEYIVDPEGCSCGGGRRVDTCEHMEAAEAADVAVSRPSRGELAYQYLALDSALRRLVQAREALAAAAVGELSEEVNELVERVEVEAEEVWERLWGGPLDLAS